MSASTFRRRVGACSIPALFAVLLATTFLDPVDERASNAAQLRTVADHVGTVKAAAALELLAALLSPIAIVTLVHLVRRRGAVLAHVGGALGVIGAVGMALIGSHHLFLVGLAKGDPAQMTAVLDRLNSAVGPAILPFFFALPLALLALAAAVWRARIAPGWVLALAAVFVVVDAALPGLPGGEAIPLLVGLVAFGWIARRVLAMSDAEWESPELAAEEPAPRPADALARA